MQNLNLMDRKKSDIPQLYIRDCYNVKQFCHQNIPQRPAIGRMVNATIEAINQEKKLPKYLIVIPDGDVIRDIEDFDYGANRFLAEQINWLVKNINLAVRCFRLQLLEKKPGAVNGNDPMIIFIPMISRVEHYQKGSKMANICSMKTKYNELLNEVVAHFEYNILCIRSCRSPDDFDIRGSLSSKGKSNFWWELNELIEKFEMGKVKLLPRPSFDHRRFRVDNQHGTNGNRRNTISEAWGSNEVERSQRSNVHHSPQFSNFIANATRSFHRPTSRSNRRFPLPRPC